MSKLWNTAAGGLRIAAERWRSYHTIQAIPREITGNRISSKDRQQGRIPAVVLTQNFVKSNTSDGKTVTKCEISRKHLITTEKKQIQSILESIKPEFFCSTKFKLQIRAGSGSSVVLQSADVMPIKIHRDESTGKILNLVFVWADEGKDLKVDVPIVFKGKDVCPGLSKGGHLNWIRKSLKYLGPPEHIPSKIELDLSKLDIGDKMSMTEVEVHPSLKLLSKNESIPIFKISSIDVADRRSSKKPVPPVES
jgi:large subunit ribosomal protein L25